MPPVYGIAAALFAASIALTPLSVFADNCPSSPPTCPTGQVLYYVPDGGPCVNTQMKCKSAGTTTATSVKRVLKPATQTPAQKQVTVSAPSGPRTLFRGMRGTDVTALQQFLITKNLLSSDSATGYFGALTEASVRAFQSKNAIVSSGTPATTGYGAVGPRTKAAMAASSPIGTSQSSAPQESKPGISSGATGGGGGVSAVPILTRPLFLGSGDAATGGEVSKLQIFLKRTGDYTNEVTGYYGPVTQAAVQSFQAENNIVSSGTPETTGFGSVGPTTLTVINTVAASGSADTTVVPTPQPTATPATPPTTTTSTVTNVADTTTSPVQPASSSGPALVTTAALKMFLMLGADANWPSLPDWYSGLIKWGYATDPNISSKPQELKAEYISVGGVPKYPYPNYPIALSVLENAEENTFLHATDPALLQMSKASTTVEQSFALAWNADARAGVSQYKVYKIWFANNFVPPLPWTEWWKQYSSWFAVASIPATSASSYSFHDAASEGDRNGWTVMCYMVKSVINGAERMYSFPVCGKYPESAGTSGVYVSSVIPKKLWENAIDTNYANVGYHFSVGISGAEASAQNYDAKLVFYKQSGFASTANQNSGMLQEEERFQLYFDATGASTNLTRQRPYMLNVSGTMKVTEDPVFRIALTHSGVETIYPRDGGYYTFSPNNRVQDRLWYGALVNPASSGWKSILSSHASSLISKGYNAIFFDTWWPDYPDQFYSEAPSVEYNPHGAMTGEYAKALDDLAGYLKSNFPSMKFLGNALGQIGNTDREFAALSSIDGGMIESCIISDGVRKTGSDLVAQMNMVDRAIGSNKTLLCWPKFQQIRWGRSIDISPFDPPTRIYALASALLMTQGQQGRFFYGPEELPGDWSPTLGQGINYFPEYRIDIGTPSSARQSLGAYVWQRQFTKGIVVVNADPSSSYSFTPTADMWKIKITGESLQLDASNQRVVNASYGTVGFEAVVKNVSISIPSASASILLSR
jgi:peptidoglycan hydrolase-like protein with peptidoglycan-binding domain